MAPSFVFPPHQLSWSSLLLYSAQMYVWADQISRQKAAKNGSYSEPLNKKYSTGMRQRICLAKAMLAEPDLLILDEPTAGLDPQSARNLREQILQIKREGRTVLLTTHYMEEADQLCDRIAIIDHGQIIAMDTPTALKRLLDERKLFTIETADWDENWGHSLLERGVSSVQTRFDEDQRHFITSMHLNGGVSAGDVLTFLVTSNAGVLNFSGREPSLEDVFIHLTGKSLRE